MPRVVQHKVSHCAPNRSRCAASQRVHSHAVYQYRSGKTCPRLATPEKRSRWRAHRATATAMKCWNEPWCPRAHRAKRGRPEKNDSHNSIVLSREQRLHAFVLECDRKEAFHARFILRVALGLLLWRLPPLWRCYNADVTVLAPGRAFSAPMTMMAAPATIPTTSKVISNSRRCLYRGATSCLPR